MSTVNQTASAGCGCATPQVVTPDSLQVVPAGSVIVQAPCADACLPPSSSNIAAVQQEAAAAQCANYANPCVVSTFSAVAINANGTFFAACSSSWAMPGLILFFPGLGYLEVLGVSGDIITYKNLTIESGTEILAGVCFHVDAPGVNVISEEEEGGGGDASATLDALWGHEGNVAKHILPVDGMILAACGGKWQRRQAGLMYYPITRTLAWSATGVGNKALTYNLPDLPTEFACSLGLQAVFSAWIFTAGSTVSTALQGHLYVNGVKYLQTNDESASNGNSNNTQLFANIGVGNTTASLELKTDNGSGAENGGGAGTLGMSLYLEGYMH